MISNDEDLSRLQAFKNAAASIDFDQVFPDQVFCGEWQGFLFFQSDYVFAPEFVDFVKEILEVELGSMACIVNLDKTEAYEIHQAALLFINEETDQRQYMEALRGDGPADGWLYAMDRFICTSDVGRWCVYCEKSNDVAVVGLRDIPSGNALDVALGRVHAKPIEVLLKDGASPQFPFDRLIPAWRQGLVENYGRCEP
ncbi:hypothetical protein N5J06_20040 [Ralstonia sp. CHL-2022]|uniref:Uncharacterized protein n=1 Tax=Ralstonia mojiangensis TaxID=2953895 RepID=A0ABT2LD00_9RALS|nr:hypothetical protein [Ralstonia mojiangensis]MCT7313271.1 hypothetical protein [Ralstonia mojiangensis]